MEDKDQRLWLMAKKRAAFKRNLFSYLVINAFLWLLWWFISGRHQEGKLSNLWPLWVTLGWGVGVAFNYFDAYHRTGNNLEQKEYDRLKNKNNGNG